MTIDKQKLKALAEAATQSHGARRVEVDHNGVHVIGDGSWKILSAWHTPDGKGAQNAEFAAAASPATVLALLAEIERLESQVRLAGVAGEMAVHEAVGRATTDFGVAVLERDQLKAENEALRNRVAEDERKLDALLAHCDDGECVSCGQIICPHGDGMHFHHDGCPSCAQIDAAMAKEANHG